MKIIAKVIGCFLLAVALDGPAMATDIPSDLTLFKNVNVFDGTSEKLLEGYDVLVVRNLIKKVVKNIPTEGTYELDVKTGGVKKLTVDVGCIQTYSVITYEEGKVGIKQVKVNVIDGKGITLMPDLTDAHWHAMYVSMPSLDEMRTKELDYIYAVANEEVGRRCFAALPRCVMWAALSLA